MLPAFVITLREGLETVVVLGAIAILLVHQGRRDQLARVWAAAGAAAFLCGGLTVALRVVEVSLSPVAEDRFEAAVSLVAVLMVAYMVVWMRRFPKELVLDADTGRRSLTGSTTAAMMGVAFFAVLREGLEISVFLLALSGAKTTGPLAEIAGAVAGLLVAAGIAVVAVRGGHRLDIARFFRVSAIVLVVTAAGLAMSAVAAANAGGWLVFGLSPQYNWSALAPPGTVLGSIVTGTFGIQPYPDLLEVVVWLTCLVTLLGVVLLPRRRREAPPRSVMRRAVVLANVGGLAAVAVLGLGLRATMGEAPSAGSAQPPQMPVPLDALTSGSYLLFRDTALGPNYGQVALVAADDPGGPRAITGLSCDRVDFEGRVGLCLTRPTSGLVVSTSAVIFNADFRAVGKVGLTGLPSRARVSPDGHWGAVTTFVTGDSYATPNAYSTRTDVIDMRTGKVLFNLEQLAVTRDGQRFHAADFNFWGVTFSNDERHFYATLGTGGETYLILGNLRTRRATVIATNVECPSLSPNGTEIAFKRRLPGPAAHWRLSVLDLATMRVHALAETRSVDDQVEWLDNSTVLYGVLEDRTIAALDPLSPSTPSITNGAPLATDTWSVPADGRGSPKLFNTGTWSEVVTGR